MFSEVWFDDESFGANTQIRRAKEVMLWLKKAPQAAPFRI